MPTSTFSLPVSAVRKKKQVFLNKRRCRSAEQLTEILPTDRQVETGGLKSEKNKYSKLKVWYPLGEEQAREILQSQTHEDIIYLTDSIFEKHFTPKDYPIVRELIFDVISFSKKKDYSELKLSCLITIYFQTHKFAISNKWQSHSTVFNFFKEKLLQYAIEDAPSSIRVFNRFHVEDIITRFTKNYMPILPLLQWTKWYFLEITWKGCESSGTSVIKKN